MPKDKCKIKKSSSIFGLWKHVVCLPRYREAILRGHMSHSPRKGFTLIELLIAMVLFVFIVSVVTEIFVIALRSEKDITALMSANDNTFITLEEMARELRVGRTFIISPSGTSLDFIDPAGNPVGYCFADNAIKRAVGDLSSVCSGSNWKKITADNIVIDSFEIRARGEHVGDGEPTRITLLLSVGTKGGSVRVQGVQTHIQTTTTVRNLDN